MKSDPVFIFFRGWLQAVGTGLYSIHFVIVCISVVAFKFKDIAVTGRVMDRACNPTGRLPYFPFINQAVFRGTQIFFFFATTECSRYEQEQGCMLHGECFFSVTA